MWKTAPLYQCGASEIMTNFEDNYFIIICRTRMDNWLWMLWEERRIWLAYQVSVGSSSNLPVGYEQVCPKQRRQLSIPCKAFHICLVYDSKFQSLNLYFMFADIHHFIMWRGLGNQSGGCSIHPPCFWLPTMMIESFPFTLSSFWRWVTTGFLNCHFLFWNEMAVTSVTTLNIWCSLSSGLVFMTKCHNTPSLVATQWLQIS